MSYQLFRATRENELFRACEGQWTQQLEDMGEDAPAEYFQMPLSFARSIIESRVPSVTDDYCIYILMDREASDHMAILHVNHMHRNSTDPVLKILWAYISPKFNFPGQDYELFATINTLFITCTLILSKTDMPSKEVKILIQNETDRRVYTSVVAAMKSSRSDIKLEIKGSWVHMCSNDD